MDSECQELNMSEAAGPIETTAVDELEALVHCAFVPGPETKHRAQLCTTKIHNCTTVRVDTC